MPTFLQRRGKLSGEERSRQGAGISAAGSRHATLRCEQSLREPEASWSFRGDIGTARRAPPWFGGIKKKKRESRKYSPSLRQKDAALSESNGGRSETSTKESRAAESKLSLRCAPKAALMASVLGNNSRAGAQSGQVKCKLKRRRRRRSKRKEKVSMLSALIAPFKYISPGTSSTEDEDSLSTSSAEVKENRNIGNLEDRSIGSAECQSLFCSDSARSGSSGLKRKRPLEEDNNGHLCQLRLIYKKLSWSEAPKNALVQLNELRPGLQYRMVSQTGPVHAPVFSIAVEVNGLTFEGTGPTKKKAKMRAAELALKSFIQFPNAPQAHLAMGNISNPSADFTSDQADFPDTLFKEFESSPCSDGLSLCNSAAESELLSSELLRHGRLLRHTLDLMVQAQQRLGGIVPEPEAPKSPVALLNELRPGLRYACLSEQAEGRRLRSFVMAVRVDGRIFEGCGRSKKQAKNQAAQCALQALFNIRTAPEGRIGLKVSRKSCPHLPQALLDKETEKHLKAPVFPLVCVSNLHAERKVVLGNRRSRAPFKGWRRGLKSC